MYDDRVVTARGHVAEYAIVWAPECDGGIQIADIPHGADASAVARIHGGSIQECVQGVYAARAAYRRWERYAEAQRATA